MIGCLPRISGSRKGILPSQILQYYVEFEGLCRLMCTFFQSKVLDVFSWCLDFIVITSICWKPRIKGTNSTLLNKTLHGAILTLIIKIEKPVSSYCFISLLYCWRTITISAQSNVPQWTVCFGIQLLLYHAYTNFHSTNYFHFQNSLQCMNVFLRCKGMSITYQVPDIVTWQDLHCGFQLDWPHLPSNANGINLFNYSRAAPRCSVDRWRYHQYEPGTKVAGILWFFWHASKRSGLRALDGSMHSMYVYELLQLKNYRTGLPGSIVREPKENFHVGFNKVSTNMTTTYG